MKATIRLSLLCLLTGLYACSDGGGDDGDGGRNVAGTWTGAITKVSDTCSGSTAPSAFNFSHVVTQNDEAIILRDQGNVQYLGNTLSDDGFSVDAANVNSGANCNDDTRIRYDGIDGDSDATAGVEITILRDCGGATCSIEYSGTASRNAPAPNPNPNPTPTPAPGATPTPVPTATPNPSAGGCLAINPNPANDSYSGDGECGISEVVYRTGTQGGQSVVILEPFGANGATSFNLNSGNSSLASSARTDLTIRGETGYSCSLACSPPSTFTVSCFKEGSVTCSEKF
jgi:hypothetical protein